MCMTDFRALMDVFAEACKEAGYANTEKVDAPLTGQKRAKSPESPSGGESRRGTGGTRTFKRGRYS